MEQGNNVTNELIIITYRVDSSGAITARQCPKRCSRQRRNLNSTQSNGKFLTGIRAGGVANTIKNLVSTARVISGGTFGANSLSTSPVACKPFSKRRWRAHWVNRRRPTRFWSTVQSGMVNQPFPDASKAASLLSYGRTAQRRLYQTWTLWVGCLSFLVQICRIWH